MRISTLLFLCALALSATAAYYSIVGLATIFSSAYVPVIIMAGILEISKLVVASWLYQKWDTISGPIKVYLTSAVLVLMVITSLGIFGFLSRAHVEQNLNNREVSLRIEQVDSQMASVQEIMQRYRTQLEQLDRSINIQLDSNRANQALAARQRQTTERDQIRQRLDAEQQRLQELTQQRTTLRQQISVLESEVGPIRYVAEFFVSGSTVDLEKAVRWMIVVLVLVFDPLAVLMLIAANMSFEKERIKNQIPQSVVQSPIIGTLRYDQDGVMCWNGAEWLKIKLEPTNADIPPDQPLSKQDITHAVDESMERWTRMISKRSEEIENTINDLKAKYESLQEISRSNIDDIRMAVKLSMDEWLTRTADDSQAFEEDATIVDHESRPNKVMEMTQADINIGPVMGDQQTTQDTPPKQGNTPSSWL